MAQQKTYLELSDGTANKFYEVIVDGASYSVRYGRIGTIGQSKTTACATAALAKAAAKKKLDEKLKEGYAAKGSRAKPAATVAKKSAPAKPPKPKAIEKPEWPQAPVLWMFPTKKPAFGIFIDRDRCWLGNNEGLIYALDHDGNALQSYQLPKGVGCLIADEAWRYAGCDDGNIYDLTGRVPRVAYRVEENVEVQWLDIYRGLLAISDGYGGLTIVNFDGKLHWKKKSTGSSGWMVRCDGDGVYHGHKKGVTAYEWTKGKKLWHQPAGDGVSFGWQEGAWLYASTYDGKVCQISKSGQAGVVCVCDTDLQACATAPEGRQIFAGDSSGFIYGFDAKGARQWKLATGCGFVNSMQYFEGRLYLVTVDGTLACVDVSDAAIQAALQGATTEARTLEAPKLEAVSSKEALEVVSSTAKGIVVECYKVGKELHMRVVSPGFNPEWRVQFPQDIRVEGTRYVVDEVRTASQGGFYRALGDIRRLKV